MSLDGTGMPVLLPTPRSFLLHVVFTLSLGCYVPAEISRPLHAELSEVMIRVQVL